MSVCFGFAKEGIFYRNGATKHKGSFFTKNKKASCGIHLVLKRGMLQLADEIGFGNISYANSPSANSQVKLLL